MTCGQVGWPILWICALNLTHPSAHMQQWTHTSWTHTQSSGQPYCCGTRGVVGGSVPCSSVSAQSWYWRWRESACYSLPHRQFLPNLRLEPVGYKSESLSIRPLLPLIGCLKSIHYLSRLSYAGLWGCCYLNWWPVHHSDNKHTHTFPRASCLSRDSNPTEASQLSQQFEDIKHWSTDHRPN